MLIFAGDLFITKDWSLGLLSFISGVRYILEILMLSYKGGSTCYTYYFLFIYTLKLF